MVVLYYRNGNFINKQGFLELQPREWSKKKERKPRVANMLPQLQSVTVSVAPWRKQLWATTFPPAAAWSPAWEGKGSSLFLDGRAFPFPGPWGGAPGLLAWSAPQPESPGATPPPTGSRQLQISMFYLILCKLKWMRIFWLQKKNKWRNCQDTGSKPWHRPFLGLYRAWAFLVGEVRVFEGKIRKI